jgi:hypothetical protein
MKLHISQALGLNPKRVGIKATTNELLGFIGRGRALPRWRWPLWICRPELDRDLNNMGVKAEITWKRLTPEGERYEVNARRAGKEWKFYHRQHRFEIWEPV